MANLYNAVFLDHAKNPDYKYQMDDPTMSHEGINPSCGDELTFSVRLAADGTIEEAAFTGSGCAISQASADMMSDLMVDKTPQEAIELCELFKRMIRGEETDEDLLEEQLDEAAMLRDIAHMPARVKCAELAWRTLQEMLEAHDLAGVGSATATVAASCDHDHTHDEEGA